MKRHISIWHKKFISGDDRVVNDPFYAIDCVSLHHGDELPTFAADWLADQFAHVADFNRETEFDDFSICEDIFHEINTRQGCFDQLVSQEQIASENTHTTTSVGDLIQVDQRLYLCMLVGFKEIRIKKSKI